MRLGYTALAERVRMIDVLIVGAGLTGLSCARHLLAQNVSVQLMEAGDAPGGRVRTDVEEGFRLDRGFQILLTGYPEVQQQIDIAALHVGSFAPGASIWHNDRFHTVTDPWRMPSKAFATLFDSVLPLGDKMRISRLRSSVGSGNAADLFTRPEIDTLSHLRELGFSSTAIERFFRPFFGGVFLESELASSSRWFEFLFRIFSEGESVLPKEGMQAVPQQFADALPDGVLRLNTTVERYEPLKADGRNAGVRVLLAGGEAIEARTLVIATQASAARSIVAASTGRLTVEDSNPASRWNRTTTFYYAAEKSPSTEKLLWLNGEGRSAGPVNNACVVSNVAPSYAPPGAHLIAASVVGESPLAELQRIRLEDDVQEHLGHWFGPDVVARWRLLGAYFLDEALPQQIYCDTGAAAAPRPRSLGPGIFLAGDYCATASIHGALSSGRATAEAVLPQLLQ
jgi:phytoene dehydrogenase-like protein